MREGCSAAHYVCEATNPLLLRQIAVIGDRLRHWARLRDGNPAHAWGKRGEDLAQRYLQSQCYTVIGRNWRTRSGSAEVDLIAALGDTIVFVEVKTRETDVFGAPEHAVDDDKRRHLRRAAAEYLHLIEASADRARFDIISVLFANGETIVHYPDAIPKQEPI